MMAVAFANTIVFGKAIEASGAFYTDIVGLHAFGDYGTIVFFRFYDPDGHAVEIGEPFRLRSVFPIAAKAKR